MSQFSGAPVLAKRKVRRAKPRPEIDRKALREKINKQFSKTLEYLAK
jgi:hypothetical protein